MATVVDMSSTAVDTATEEQDPGSRADGGRARRSRLGLRTRLAMLGPAFVAAIAYVDPGNVAANVSAGAQFGYLLVWVLVVSNVFAMLIQYLSGKLGLVTGRALPELLGERLPRGRRIAYWAQAELAAAATDVAEVIGGALALYILFDIPLPIGGAIVGLISLALLAIRTRGTDSSGRRRGQVVFERVIVVMLVIITLGFVAGLTVAPVDWGEAAGGLQPQFDGSASVLLAASMLGATVMPHAIYLHSSLVTDRHGTANSGSRLAALMRAHRIDVVLALVVAGSVNIAMLLLAAAGLQGVEGTDSITGAHAAIDARFGAVIGLAFAIGLLFSGLASTSVGCYAGEAIMAGLLKVRISMLLRRVLTLAPAIVLLAVGVDPTFALILSQVVLSMCIPFALIPLLRLTADRELMGERANKRWLNGVGAVIAVAIIALNAFLVVLTFMGG